MDGSPSSIVTMGFSTGSFSPVVGLVVTLGFGVGAPAVIVAGPYRWSALGFHEPGAAAGGLHEPGMAAGSAEL